MKPYVKMMLMNAGNGGNDRRDSSRRSPRSEYDGGGMEYDMRMEDERRESGNRPRMGDDYEIDNRFRDRRGRERYDDGRFSPVTSRRGGRRGGRREGGNMEMYAAGERGGNRGGNRGGSMEINGYRGGEMRRGARMEDDDDEEEMRGDFWPYPPIIPPYGGGDNLNEIGFERGMDAHYEGFDEMKNRRSEKEHGHAMGAEEFNHETAREWTSSMHNEDGTTGPHWTMDQAKQVMAQRGIKHDPAAFWAILNAMYSDYCAVFKKHGVNNMDFYVDMTNAWLDDKDAVEDKAGAYYEYVVKH